MSAWQMEVKVNGVWKAVRPTDAQEPYRYDTLDEAKRMLEICYPDLCVEARLTGTLRPYIEPNDMSRVRLVEVTT